MFCFWNSFRTRAKYGPNRETFTYSMSLVFIQCVINSIVGKFFTLSSNKGHQDTTTHFFYGGSALTYLTAMVASTSALQYVSYPTQVIAKSCKPIPVMLIGVLYAHKRYSFAKYMFVLLIVIGVGIFLYNPNKISVVANSTPLVGELFLLLSLTCDGFTGAFQVSFSSTISQ